MAREAHFASIRRKIIAAAFVGSALIILSSADAQPASKTHYTIGFLSAGSPGPGLPLQEFQQGLRDLGYVEGQNMVPVPESRHRLPL